MRVTLQRDGKHQAGRMPGVGQPQKERGHSSPSIGIVQIVTNGDTASFNSYAYDEPGLVVVNEAQRAELRVRKIS